jgi:hypothetical protein
VFPHVQAYQFGHFANDPNERWVSLSTCPACAGVIATAAVAQGEGATITSMLPTAIPAQPDELIPAAIRVDLFEARLCFSVGAYKATAGMCRRALQGAVVQQGATPKKTLAAQIDEVVNSNKVHASLKDWADAIRLIGNSGAHVGDDGLETVTAEEAQDLLDFTEQFLELTYVVTARVKSRLADRIKPAP